jgi:hypothetical protein
VFLIVGLQHDFRNRSTRAKVLAVCEEWRNNKFLLSFTFRERQSPGVPERPRLEQHMTKHFVSDERSGTIIYSLNAHNDARSAVHLAKLACPIDRATACPCACGVMRSPVIVIVLLLCSDEVGSQTWAPFFS